MNQSLLPPLVLPLKHLLVIVERVSPLLIRGPGRRPLPFLMARLVSPRHVFLQVIFILHKIVEFLLDRVSWTVPTPSSLVRRSDEILEPCLHFPSAQPALINLVVVLLEMLVFRIHDFRAFPGRSKGFP